jgi:hypothetical protein
MSRWLIVLGFGACLVGPRPVQASSLAKKLSASDIRRVVEIIGLPAAARLMRSAETYPSWPGVKIGIEVLALGERGLNDIGDRSGTLPSVNPIPRLYLSKGLFWDTELTISFFPTSDVNPVATLGVMLKHCFYQEQTDWLSLSAFVGITDIEAFRSSYHGTDFEAGLLISKDYVRLKPYVGLGVLIARGEVDRTLLDTGVADNDAWAATLHAFIGTEIELPLTFGAQLDLFNLAVGASFFVGKKF